MPKQPVEPETLLRIRDMWRDDKGRSEIAKELGMNVNTVGSIILRRAWWKVESKTNA